MKIIQIGANNGNDFVYEFIEKNKNHIELAILVEPILSVIDALKNKYKNIPNIHIENKAISDNENDNNFVLYYADNKSAFSSFNKNHLIVHGCNINEIKTLNCPCMTINKLIENYNIIYLDYLFIDTEGLDCSIIKSINFKNIKIKNIVFEYVHSDGPQQHGEKLNDTKILLERIEYNMQKYDNLNMIAILKI